MPSWALFRHSKNPSVSKTRTTPSVSLIPQNWFSSRPLHAICYLQYGALDDDSTQHTRTVRECCGSGWGGDDSMQFRAVQAMFCTKLGAPCSSLQKQHTSNRASHHKKAAWAAQQTVLQNSRVDVSTGSGRNVRNQCLLALLLCEKYSLGAVRCDAMQTVCRGLTNAVRSVLQVALFALRWTGSC